MLSIRLERPNMNQQQQTMNYRLLMPTLIKLGGIRLNGVKTKHRNKPMWIGSLLTLRNLKNQCQLQLNIIQIEFRSKCTKMLVKNGEKTKE